MRALCMPTMDLQGLYTPHRGRPGPPAAATVALSRLPAMANAARVGNRKDTTLRDKSFPSCPYAPPVDFRVGATEFICTALLQEVDSQKRYVTPTLNVVRNVRGKGHPLPCRAPQMSWRANLRMRTGKCTSATFDLL